MMAARLEFRALKRVMINIHLQRFKVFFTKVNYISFLADADWNLRKISGLNTMAVGTVIK
jgi:hypothetical protein